MNHSPEDTEPTLKGINAADLIARGLESAKAATGNPQAWQPPTPEELAALLPQYEIEALLGRGGMGAVYRGKQAALDRTVAIKLLPAELAADADFIGRFQREARTLAKLQHPGIVAVHDFGQTSAGHLYFVMEFVNGTDLARLIHGPGINPAQALEVITQICDALQYAHSQGVIHRDIKPANVLLTQEGRAKLADFGLARPLSEDSGTLTRSNVVMGTPDYMAPEQMAGNADHRADLYALGVMLYEMLTGQTPRGAWAPPSQRVQVDVRLDQVVVRALQQDPAMRYQQASEIKTDVDVIRTTPLPKAGKAKVKLASEAPGQRTTPLPKAKKPGSWAAWAAVIVVALLALAGWWVMQSDSKPAASNLHWQRVEYTDAEWEAIGRIKADGWIPVDSAQGRKKLHVFDLRANRLAHARFAIRAHIEISDKPDHWVEFRYLNEPQLPAILFRKGSVEVKHPEGNQKQIIGLQLTSSHQVEIVFLDGTIYSRIDNAPQMTFAFQNISPCKGLYVNGFGSGDRVKDVEYAILDGIPDPLKVLGWEVPVDAPTTIPWTRVERSAEEWAKTGQTLQKDGWVHNPGKSFILFDRLSSARATSQFAIRAKVKFHEKEASMSFRNDNGGGHRLRAAQFWAFKQGMTNEDSRPFASTQRHVSKVELDQEALVEVLFAKDKAYISFNHEPLMIGDMSPALPWEQCFLLGGLNHSLRDIEYAILDGVPEPLKALGWEVPEPTSPHNPVATNGSGDPNVDQIVDWVFKYGGEVTLLQDGKIVTTKDPKEVLGGKFELIGITMRGESVTDEEFARLASVPTLRRLHLQVGSKITSLRPLAGLTQLRYLSLQDNVGLKEEEVAHLSGLAELQLLSLKLPDATGESFRHLAGLKKLDWLLLYEGKLTEAGSKAIANLSSLYRLSLSHCIFKDNQRALAPIGEMTKLKSLELVKDEISAEGFALLAGLKTIENLNLSDSRIDNAGFALLTGSRGTLKILNVDMHATISDEGIRHIVANFPNLEEINLSMGSTCTGASIRELAKLPELRKMSCWVMKGLKPGDYSLFADLPMIERLSIEDTNITDEALPAFAKCEHLVGLALMKNAITDAGLKALTNIRPLRTLNVSDTKITSAGLAEFQKARPDVQVIHNLKASSTGAN